MFAACAAAAVSASTGASSTATVFPGAEWAALGPAESGWSQDLLTRAWQEAEAADFAGGLVVQRGRVVASFGAVDQPLPVRSIRKSLLNSVIGLLVADGRLRLDQTLSDLSIDDERPRLTAGEKRARVVDLLTARSGVYHPAAYESDGQDRERPRPGQYAPGEHFYYNNWDFNALGTIANRAAGRSLFEEFAERIARPLRLQDFSLKHTEWRREEVSVHPAYLFEMSARDLARFGLLYLEEGRWDGTQLLPASWVRESVRPHTNRPREADYGYLWWSQEPLQSKAQTERVFMARGNGMQTIWVIPEDRVVIVLVTDTRTMALKKMIGRVPTVQEFFRVLHLLMDAAPKGSTGRSGSVGTLIERGQHA